MNEITTNCPILINLISINSKFFGRNEKKLILLYFSHSNATTITLFSIAANNMSWEIYWNAGNNGGLELNQIFIVLVLSSLLIKPHRKTSAWVKPGKRGRQVMLRFLALPRSQSTCPRTIYSAMSWRTLANEGIFKSAYRKALVYLGDDFMNNSSLNILKYKFLSTF